VSRPTAVVIGVGAARGLGAAVCRRFAAAGHHVLVAGRTAARIAAVADDIIARGGSAEAVPTDATQEADVQRLFARAMAPGPGREPVDAVVFNAGNNQRIDFRELTAEQFEYFWRVGCFAGFLAPLGRGSILFTGASGSLRGRPGFAHFAAAKSGLRMLAQSMAREFGPLGIHVAHVVIDGGINGEKLRNAFPAMVERLGEDGLLDVDAIAETYWQLHCQPRTAWAHEVDLRPYKEGF
jgi:NAD(P)-dependent dehydrogenase (short-subunit alcohol dehydrogenase family)